MLNCIRIAASVTASAESAVQLGIWVPAAISVVSLVVTTVFTIFIAPRISSKQTQKIAMYELCSEFFELLTDIVSKKSFDDVLSQIRKYSLKIHMMFKSGEAPESISVILEEIYRLVRERKKMTDEAQVSEWSEVYRDKVRALRKELAKYVGVFN